MPPPSRVKSTVKGKEPPLHIRGEGLGISSNGSNIQSIDKDERRGSIPLRRRSSSVGRVKVIEKEKETSSTQRMDGSCSDCGKTHHGLLQLQYTQSLEQQIALLELENNFIKQQQSQLHSCHIPHQHPPPHVSSHPHPHPHSSHPNQSQHSIHQPYPITSHHRPSQGPIWNQMIPEVSEVSPPPSDSDRGNGLMDSDRRRRREESNQSIKRTNDTELLHRLEEYSQRLLQLERKLKEKMRESRGKEETIVSLQNRLKELEGNISNKNDMDTQQKRALMEEILDLQRRLDELTPILANKEALIARIENEKDELQSRIRSLQSENNQLQIRLSDRNREESVRSEQEEERRRERQRIEMLLKEKDGEIDSAKARERVHMEELARMKRELHEEEIKRSQQKNLLDRSTEENGKLVKECSRLSAEVSRLEMRADHAERESKLRQMDKDASRELAEMKEKESSLRLELTQVQESLHAERECITLLQNQLKDGGGRELEIRESRIRMERELEALQVLSKSLSAENATLRQEKMSQGEHIDSLRIKFLEKDRNIHELEEKLRESERKYEDAIARVEEESSAQRLRTIELEELGQKLKDLSESLPRSSHNSATRISFSREPSTIPHHQPSTSFIHPPPIQSNQSHSSIQPQPISQRSHHSSCSLPIQSKDDFHSTSIDEVIQMTRTAIGTIHHS